MARGRITSGRMSPTLGRSICLGYLADEFAEPGSVVMVALSGGQRIDAAVMPTLASVDPEGARLRV